MGNSCEGALAPLAFRLWNMSSRIGEDRVIFSLLLNTNPFEASKNDLLFIRGYL
jgi:hypothetical protein